VGTCILVFFVCGAGHASASELTIGGKCRAREDREGELIPFARYEMSRARRGREASEFIFILHCHISRLAEKEEQTENGNRKRGVVL